MMLLNTASFVTACLVAAVFGSDDAETKGQITVPFRYPLPKYFRESSAGPHYDFRYATWTLDPESQQDGIKVLIQTYLSAMRDLGVETWLMHGSLLGWWWGKKVLPWDYDADFQVSEADLDFLASYYNMTTYYYQYDKIPNGRSFLLDINPSFRHRGMDDMLNVIDARWIDMDSGLYVDITAVRYSLIEEEGEGMLYDKSGHRYRDTYLYPLRDTTFEGAPAKIPYRYQDMLESEYTGVALTNRYFEEHHFDKKKMQWISDMA